MLSVHSDLPLANDLQEFEGYTQSCYLKFLDNYEGDEDLGTSSSS